MIKLWKGDDCPYIIEHKKEGAPIIEFYDRKDNSIMRKGIIKRINTRGEYLVEEIK